MKDAGHRGPLSAEFMLRWATDRGEHSWRYRAERLSIVRLRDPSRTTCEHRVPPGEEMKIGLRGAESRLFVKPPDPEAGVLVA